MVARLPARTLAVAVLLALSGLVAGCGAVRWETSYDTGMRQAMEQRRRVLLQFVSTVSPACTDMDLHVFTDSEVRRLMKNFVPIRLDTVIDKDLTRHFNVPTTPAFYVIRPDGQVVGSQIGKLDAEKFRTFLIKYSYN